MRHRVTTAYIHLCAAACVHITAITVYDTALRAPACTVLAACLRFPGRGAGPRRAGPRSRGSAEAGAPGRQRGGVRPRPGGVALGGASFTYHLRTVPDCLQFSAKQKLGTWGTWVGHGSFRATTTTLDVRRTMDMKRRSVRPPSAVGDGGHRGPVRARAALSNRHAYCASSSSRWRHVTIGATCRMNAELLEAHPTLLAHCG